MTVLVPGRNEERDIAVCLEAICAQDYPHERMEVLLVDGASTDRMVERAREILGHSDLAWQILPNPKCSTPTSLNAGLAAATGAIVCRIDARSVVPPDYVRRCVEVLSNQDEIVVVGGAQVALPVDRSRRARGIARALNNRFTMGGSKYRARASSGPADTVYLGAFRTAQLRESGGWDPYFETNQDYELNRRLGQDGTVWFDAHLRVGYVPRNTIGALWRQYHRFGRWKTRYWRRTGDRPQRRQLVALVLPPIFSIAIGAWAAGSSHRAAAAAVTGVAGALVLDELGADGGEEPIVRCVSALASAVVVSAWLSGAYAQLAGELLGGRSDPAETGADPAHMGLSLA